MASLPHSNTMLFFPHILTVSSTWCPCPLQPVSLLGSSPSPSIRLAQAIFKPNCFLYKYPNNLILFIFRTYTAYEDGTDRVFQNVGT